MTLGTVPGIRGMPVTCPLSLQGGGAQGGEPHVSAECRHRLWPHTAAAGQRGEQHGHAHGLPEPGGGAHPQPLWIHLSRGINPGDTCGDKPGSGDLMEQQLQEGLGHVSPWWWLHEGQRSDPAQGRGTLVGPAWPPCPTGAGSGGVEPQGCVGLGGVPLVSGALQCPTRQAVIPRVGAGSVQVGSACWTVAPAGGQGEAGLGHGWSPPPHSQIKSPFRPKGEVLLAGHGDIHGWHSRGSVLLSYW